MESPEHIKETKTAEELAAMIREDLSQMDGCPKQGVTVTVYGIPEDAPVTIIGAVALRDGRPVLVHPRERYLGIEVGRLIISPLPDDTLNKQLRINGQPVAREKILLGPADIPFTKVQHCAT